MKRYLVTIMVFSLALGSICYSDENSSERPEGTEPVAVEAGGIGALVIAEVLIIKDNDPWDDDGNEQALDSIPGKTWDVIITDDIAGTTLSDYRIVIVASDQFTATYDALIANAAALASYVDGGGILLAHGCDNGWNGGHWSSSWLPGGVYHVDTYQDSLSIVDATSPIVDGISDADLDGWGYSTHGYFTGLVAGTNIIIGITNGDPTGKPTYIEYTHGSGLVLATMQTMEWPWAGGGGTTQLLINEIEYAQEYLSLEKTLLSGPEEIGICLPDSTEYVFEITYSGPDAMIIDTVPAEFEVTECVDGGVGIIDYFAAGKGPKSKSATIITWNVSAGSSTLTVTIETRESPGGGHKLDTFKPTSCEEDMELNDGAMAYQVDEFGDPILDQFGEMIPIEGLEDGSGPLTVDAVCGAKPCAPENLVVTGGGTSTTLSLEWDDVCGGEGVVYNVYRGSQGGPYTQINTEPVPDSEYDDEGLDPGNYCYVVEAEYTAQVKHLESDKSNEDCGTVDEP